jgi:hypothetical protein
MRFASLLITGAVISVVLCAPAWANMVITPTFDSTITSDTNSAAIEGAINSAIAVYEADFSDPINVNIKFQEGGGLGGSDKTLYTIPYTTFYGALVADAKSSDDATAVAHNAPLTGGNNPVNNTRNIDITTANIRALNIPGSFPSLAGICGTTCDGLITLNTALTNPGSPATTGQYALMAVAEHEIDEVLGLGSSIATFPDPMPEDLFRYTSTPGVRSFDTSTSSVPFFSIDGTTDLAEFHQQNGDMGDYGDWQTGVAPPQVQDWEATPFSNPALSVELRALDVIGYDRVVLAPVPEPGTAALLASALALLAGFTKRRTGTGPSTHGPNR